MMTERETGKGERGGGAGERMSKSGCVFVWDCAWVSSSLSSSVLS